MFQIDDIAYIFVFDKVCTLIRSLWIENFVNVFLDPSGSNQYKSIEEIVSIDAFFLYTCSMHNDYIHQFQNSFFMRFGHFQGFKIMFETN